MRTHDRQTFLHTALDEGFSYFDTAPIYGEGLAERSLGRFLAGGLRQRVSLASKFGMPANRLFKQFPGLMYAHRALGSFRRRLSWPSSGLRVRDLSLVAAEASLTHSLHALRTDWLDVLFVHEPIHDDIPALQVLSDWLMRQKRSGRVRFLGLAGGAAACVAVTRAIPGIFDILQVEDSLTGQEADLLLKSGLPLQITYGYLRLHNAGHANSAVDPLAIFQEALQRNSCGSLLVSTRKPSRLRDLASLAR